MKPLTRLTTRAVIQHAPLSWPNRQRVYNFFARDASSAVLTTARVRLPDGGAVRVGLDLDEDMDRQWFYWGYSGYETAVVRAVWQLIAARRYETVIEVGANIGYFTLLIAARTRQFMPTGRVYAFEPYPPVLGPLRGNVGLNPGLPIQIEAAAVADRDGEVELFVPADDHALTNASLVRGLFDQKGSIRVPSVRLDSFAASRNLGRVGLLKLDCEGAEPDVLRGAEGLLAACRPDVVCEVLPPIARELDEYFARWQYRKYLLTTDGPVPTDRLEADVAHRDYLLTTTPLPGPSGDSR